MAKHIPDYFLVKIPTLEDPEGIKVIMAGCKLEHLPDYFSNAPRCIAGSFVQIELPEGMTADLFHQAYKITKRWLNETSQEEEDLVIELYKLFRETV